MSDSEGEDTANKSLCTVCEKKRAYYCSPSDPDEPTHCPDCKPWNFVPMPSLGLCQEEGCSKQAKYGHAGGEKEYCAPHKEDGMVLLCSTLQCEAEGCSKQKSFGFLNADGTGEKQFCATHKAKGMVNIGYAKSKVKEQCATEACSKKRRFGISQEGPTRCASHKTDLLTAKDAQVPDNERIEEDDIIDWDRKCHGDGCTGKRAARWGKRGTPVVMEYCQSCAEDLNEDISDKAQQYYNLDLWHNKRGHGEPVLKKKRTIWV